MVSVLIEVYGRVQGVRFRAMTKAYADSVGLKGIVMNREDGAVLIVVQDGRDRIKEFIAWLKQNHGLSRVDKVVVRGLRTRRDYRDFAIVRDDFFRDHMNSFLHFGRDFLKL